MKKRNQTVRFYPIKGRRIKKIRGYARRTDKVYSEIDNYCSDNDKIYEVAWIVKGIYKITYGDIIGFICVKLFTLGIKYTLSHDTISTVFTIYSNERSINIDLNEVSKSVEPSNFIEYLGRTDWTHKLK